MNKLIVFAITIITFPHLKATDWIYPDPVTLEWTVKSATEIKIPSVKYQNASAGIALKGMGDSMTFPLSVECRGLSDDQLETSINRDFVNKSWLSIISVIADEIDADVIIVRGGVIIIPRMSS